MNRALTWITNHTTGEPLIVVEGIGSYGAQIAQYAAEAGHPVVEAQRVTPRTRAGKGKSDPLDAALIARSVLATPVDKLRRPRADDGTRQALRVLLTARDQMNAERTRTINALTALLRTTDLGVDARRPLTTAQITETARWRPRHEPLHLTTARKEATRLAARITNLTKDLTANNTQINLLVAASPAQPLLAEPGIGPVNAATIYVAWSHPTRLHSEAAFAHLAGTAPIPASSGNTTRHRLDRSGDRQLNRALHSIALTRKRVDPATHAYIERRLAEGSTPREITRILKRYIARHIYRILEKTGA
jgi:transposase